MSDIKLYDFKNNKIIKKINSIDAKPIIENSLKELFHIDLVAKDYLIDNNSNDAISYLGIDENMQVVVIEYRFGRFTSLTKKGLYYIDYIKDHISRFKMLFNDYKEGIANNINYNARLLIFCDDANAYDHYAIKQLPYTIELIQVHSYVDKVAFEKVYQSRNVDHVSLSINLKNFANHDLYKYVSDYLLSLGDEVIETGVSNYLIYRKINTFAYLLIGNELTLKLLVGDNFKTYEINSIDDFDKISLVVEDSYAKC